MQDDLRGVTVPTKLTKYLRVFLPWQVWKFIVINYRIIKLIFKSHKPSK